MDTKFKSLLFSSLLMFIFCTTAKSQCSGWAHTSEPSNDNAWGITIDEAANTYSAGYYYGPSKFGNYTANDTGLFLIKYDSLGHFQWAQTFKGNYYGIFSFVNYSHDAIYLATTFLNSVTFGGTTLTANPGYYSIAIVKFDLDGNVQWARTFSCTNVSYGFGIWNTLSDDVLITGRYRGTLTMDAATLIGAVSGYSVYLAKLNANNGDVQWATSSAVEAINFSRGYVVRTDVEGNILLGGYYEDIISFGNQTLDNSAYPSAGPPYVAKFDSNGTALWIRGATGDVPLFDNTYGLETDSLNNIYFSSPVNATVNFSGTMANPVNGTFVAGKYDPSGNLLWLKQMGTHEPDSNSLLFSLHINRNHTLTGYGWGVGELFLGTDTFSSAGGVDIISVNLDEDGNYLSSFIAGGVVSDVSYSATYDSDDHAFVAGAFYGDSTTLGDFTLYGDTFNYGNYFVWKNCPLQIGDGTPAIHATDISIYPDPSDGVFFIEGISEGDPWLVEIYDLDGRMVGKRESGGENKIDLGHAPEGIYFVKIKLGHMVQLKKIVIQ